MKAIFTTFSTLERNVFPVKERKQLIIILILIIGTIFNATAANITWTNGGGTGLWTTASNWSTGAVPTATSTVIFSSTYTANCSVNTQVSITGITIQAGYTGTITQGAADSIVLSGNYAQSAGTFTGGSKAIYIDGNMTLSAGTFTSTSGNLYTEGNLSITSGSVFNANSGTVYFDLAGNTTITIPTNGSIQFNNVTFNSTVGSIITSGDTMVVGGTLSLLNNQVKTGVMRLISGSSLVTNSNFTGGNAQLDIQAPLTITPLCAAFCGVNVNNSSAVFNAPAFTFTMNGALNVYSGTFSGGTDSIWVNGAFKQTGGTFTATSGTMIFGGSFGYSAGTFNNNSGTIEFNDAANSTFTNTGLITFDNCIVNNTTGAIKLTLTATDTLKTSGTLTLTEGTTNGGYMIPGSGLSIGSSYAGGTTVMLLINAYTYTIPAGMNIPATTVNGASTIVSFASGSSPVFAGAVKLLNGTFNCNSTQWAMTQALTISGGTFNATTDTIKYSNAALTISTGATFNHNNGTFDFMNSAASTAVTNTLKTLMYNVIINLTNATKASAELTVAAGDTLVAVNSLTLAAGYFNSGLLQVEGTVNDLGVFGGGAGVLYFANGSGIRNINFASAQLPGISVNDVNVSINAPNNDVTFNGVFTLTNGQFYPSGYAITTLVAYSQSGGTFWQNTDSVTHTTTLTLSGGAYYPTSGVTIVTGAYSQTGGTFESGGGLTYFKGAFTLNVGSFYPPSAVMTVTGAFTLTAGTFYSNTYNEIFNGTFAINGGTFTATSDTTYIGSTTLTIATAATFANNNGTFTINNATGNCTVTDATKKTLYNLVVNLTNGTPTSAELKVAAGDTIAVSNTLTLAAGNLNSGIVQVEGSINDPGSFGGGTGFLNFSLGGAGRTITFTSANIPGLQLNDVNVTVTTTSTQATTVGGAVTVTKGVLSVGTYPTTFNSTYTQSGGTFGTASVNEYFVGVFDITGGAFNASSDTTVFETTTTFAAAAIFTNNSGTFSCSNSTGNFTLTVPISFNVYNFYVNMTNGTNNTMTVSAGDTVIVSNSLALVSGKVNTGFVELKGTMQSSTTAFGGGSGSVFIANGSGTRSITLPASSMPVLVLNDANATLNGPTSGTCAFQSNVTLTKGTFAGGAGIVTVAGSYSQTGGTFTGGVGSFEVATNFAISGAGTVFTAPTDTLSVAGTFTITSPATFNHNNGTLYFSGATAKALTAPSALTLGSLVVALTSGAALSPTQALTITGNLTIGSAAVLSQTTSSVNLTLAGNYNDLNASEGLLYGTQTFTFNGSSAQTISAARDTEQFYNLVMSNTSGGVTLVNAGVYVNKTLTLTPGSHVKVILDTNNLTIDSVGSISGGTSTEYIVTGGGGYLVQQGIGPSGRTGAILFPVGTTTSDYNPVTIQNAGTDDEYWASAQPTVLSSGTTGYALTEFALNLTYFLRAGSEGTSNVTLTLQWNASDELAYFDRTNCIIRHYHDNYWNDEGSYGPASGSGPYYKTVTGVTSFCPWGGGSGGGGDLPVQLVNFTGVLDGGNVNLNWSTEIEISNNYFTVERSTDGVNYTELGTVDGAGNSTVEHDYTLTDEHPVEGTNYYRLKQTDFDGNTVQVGSIVAINVAGNNSSNTVVTLYPNPLEGTELKVSMTGSEQATGAATLIITDLSGRNVYTGTFAPSVEASITLPSDLAAGMYLVKVNSGGKDYNQKLMIR